MIICNRCLCDAADRPCKCCELELEDSDAQWVYDSATHNWVELPANASDYEKPFNICEFKAALSSAVSSLVVLSVRCLGSDFRLI